MLGILYRDGRGVPKDAVQAHMWLDIAAGTFVLDDSRALVAQARDDLAKLITPEQVKQARKMARQWRLAHPGMSIADTKEQSAAR